MYIRYNYISIKINVFNITVQLFNVARLLFQKPGSKDTSFLVSEVLLLLLLFQLRSLCFYLFIYKMVPYTPSYFNFLAISGDTMEIKMIMVDSKCALFARYCSECFMFINSFNKIKY